MGSSVSPGTVSSETDDVIPFLEDVITVTAGAREPAALRRDAARNVEKIAVAAMEVFAERGLDVSMADVAERAGVGVGTVYRRFGDKNGLIMALFATQVDELIAVVDAVRPGADPGAALTALLTRSCEQLAASKGLRQLILGGGIRTTEVAGRTLDRLVPVVDELVAEAVAAGWLRPTVDANDIPAILVAVQAVRDLGGAQHPELWRRVLRILIDGIRAGGGAGLPAPAAPSAEEMRAMLESRRG